MVNYDPSSAAPAQVLTFADLPATTSPVTAAWLQHVHAVLPNAAHAQMPRSGCYITILGGNTGTGAPGASSLRASPIDLAAACTADRIGVEVTTLAASSTVRLGIYADGTDGLPGTLLLDAGTVDTTTTGFKEITISQALTAGRWWLAAVSQGAAPTVRTNGGVQMIPLYTQAETISAMCAATRGSVTGALPTPFASTSGNVTGHRVFIRCA